LAAFVLLELEVLELLAAANEVCGIATVVSITKPITSKPTKLNFLFFLVIVNILYNYTIGTGVRQDLQQKVYTSVLVESTP
jgi:hypothetical protein